MSSTTTANHDMQQHGATTNKDFWLIYPSDTESDSLTQAVHALYYLPANYKLVMPKAVYSADFMATANDAFLDRIRFEKDTPKEYAGTVIYDDTNSKATQQPSVVVSRVAAKAIAANDQQGFTVLAGNPEALATAILRISRATA